MTIDRIETHQDWHQTDSPDVLTAAIARVRAMFGLDTPATFDVARAVERTESTHMTPETLTPVSAPYEAADGFLCPSIRRAVDAEHDRAGLLARFRRVTPVTVAVAMETATCPECGETFERRAGQEHPRRYCTSRCYDRSYNRARKALRERNRKGWAAR